MDDGIIQFFVISLFVVFSILESVTRKKKAKAAREKALSGPEPDRLRAKEQARLEAGATARAARPPRPRRAGLAGLLSQEFWEEVAALKQDAEVSSGDDEDAAAAEVLPIEAPAPEPPETHWATGLRQASSHEVVEYQDAPETVPTGPRGLKDASAEATADEWQRPAVRGPSLRGSLLGSTVSDLRRAVVLYEVLGPPLALRNEGQGRSG